MKNPIKALVKGLGNLGKFLKSLWGKSLEFLIVNSNIAVEATNVLKRVTEGTVDNFAVGLINNPILTEYHSKIEAIAPELAFRVAVLSNILKSSDSGYDTVDSIAEKLKEFYPELRSNFWVRFSAELNMALEDGKISLSEGIGLTQSVFEAKKQGVI